MFTVEDLHRALILASDMGASDLDLQTEYPIFLNLYGEHKVLTRDGRILEPESAENLTESQRNLQKSPSLFRKKRKHVAV